MALNGMRVVLLALLLFGCSKPSEGDVDLADPLPESINDVEEVANDVTSVAIPPPKEPICHGTKCVLDITMLRIPVLNSQLKGALEIGYNGMEDNSVSGRSRLAYVTGGGQEMGFEFNTRIDCEGKDKIKFTVGLIVGGTSKNFSVEGDLSHKLLPLCFPIPGALIVSLCLSITEYKYDHVDRSLKLCMLVQLKINVLFVFGYNIADLHSRCMHLRKDNFDRIGSGISDFTLGQVSNLQQGLKSLISFLRTRSIDEDLSTVPTPSDIIPDGHVSTGMTIP